MPRSVLSASLLNVLRQRMIIAARLTEPPRLDTHSVEKHACAAAVLIVVCVSVCVCVLRLSSYNVPVSCTEEAFVFHSQSVETRGRWREEEVKSRINKLLHSEK